MPSGHEANKAVPWRTVDQRTGWLSVKWIIIRKEAAAPEDPAAFVQTCALAVQTFGVPPLSVLAEHPGTPKGMKQVLQERFHAGALRRDGSLAVNAAGLKDDELRAELNRYDDFYSAPSILEEIVSHYGHIVIFLPVCHPEMNAIELVWRQTKSEVRTTCTGSVVGFESRIRQALDNVSLHQHRMYCRDQMEWEMLYDTTAIGHGLNSDDAAATRFKYSSHRRYFNRSLEVQKAAVLGRQPQPEYFHTVKSEKQVGVPRVYTRVAANRWGLLEKLAAVLLQPQEEKARRAQAQSQPRAAQGGRQWGY
jgi:hypothetical protein